MSMYYNSIDTGGLSRRRVKSLHKRAVDENHKPNNIFIPVSSNKCTGERMRGKRIATLMNHLGYKVRFDGLQETKGGEYMLQFTVDVPGKYYTYYADSVEECERKYKEKLGI